VTVSAATLTGAGFTFSGATFPVTLNPTIAITVQVQYNPTAAGASSGTLTFTSNSTSGSTSVVSLTGTGTAVQHQVSLNWTAPTNSPVQVADYNIYRATGTSSSYQLVNSSSNTSYVDPTVQANTAYSYYVTGVSGTGTESSPSNQVSVTVPK
jgi:fibronectin type 3 domain-containing protein